MDHKKELPAATMKDVAEQAGVSTATVSRALMNPEKVSASTRQKVDQAVMAVGYSPHALSRNLKRNESRTILVIVPDICDPFFADLIQGIERTAAESGYLVLIGDCAQQNQQEKTFINLIITKQIDGMLLLGSDLPFDASKEEQRNLPPMVMANEFAPELELPTVHIDNLTAAFEAVLYLLNLGHQRIACIEGPKHMPLCQYRSQGYVQALRRNGISVENALTAQGDFSYESGAQAVTELMALPSPPTAIFCHNDIMAIGAMFQAKKMGLRIPQDLSVVGFDDIKASQYTDPPLTTVAQPRFQLGRQAMLLLLEQLQGNPVQNGSLLLESELVVRESTSAPGA
ncbi:DNA-binding transcriptional regulator CytR [Rahnella sp. AA]|uniref:DNA-binding transcriptional regulator CytR n=1 Tax=Rahnella sp. AA TaxID=2057180 RepID=UPI000C330AFC|nr:DNA-binding transcriptional regulator CytR [Rahnella sp. AA]PKE27736.1 DNA-binding transcriptional regulator CytR [Rahnella sp. AA]